MAVSGKQIARYAISRMAACYQLPTPFSSPSHRPSSPSPGIFFFSPFGLSSLIPGQGTDRQYKIQKKIKVLRILKG